MEFSYSPFTFFYLEQHLLIHKQLNRVEVLHFWGKFHFILLPGFESPFGEEEGSRVSSWGLNTICYVRIIILETMEIVVPQQSICYIGCQTVCHSPVDSLYSPRDPPESRGWWWDLSLGVNFVFRGWQKFFLCIWRRNWIKGNFN